MAETQTLKAEAREKGSKGAVRSLRREGRVPAVIYGEKKTPELIHVGYKEVSALYQTGTFMSHVLDVEIGGKTIKAGDRVAMWYVSGNRDEEVIERPNDYIIDRERPRQHMSFGFGIHRCVGNRVAELQLTIIWEEILKRFPEIVLVEEPKRTFSSFVKGYESMKVVIPRRN